MSTTDKKGKPQTALFAFDVEAGGSDPLKHPIIAIGTAYRVSPSAKPEKKLFVFDFRVEDFEPRCKEQFWDKHPDLLQFFLKNRSKTAAKDFVEYIQKVDTQHEGNLLLTDNTSFDTYFINIVLSKQGLRPLNYRKDKEEMFYRQIVDKDSFAAGLLTVYSKTYRDDPSQFVEGIWDSKVIEILKLDADKIPKSTHNPSDDAEHILIMMEEMLQFVARQSIPKIV